MPPVTKPVVGKEQKSYEKAWGDDKSREFQPCEGCRTPGACKAQGCLAKADAKSKAMGA